MAGATLPVGSGYVNGLESMMRIAENFAKLYGIGQILLDSGRANPLEHGQVVIQILQGVVIGTDHALQKADAISNIF